MKLIIEGNKKQVEALAKELRLRAKRNALVLAVTSGSGNETCDNKALKTQLAELEAKVEQLEADKAQLQEFIDSNKTDDEPEEKAEADEEEETTEVEKPTALVVKSLIEQARTVEELEQLVEGDERQVVRNAYKKKLKELND